MTCISHDRHSRYSKTSGRFLTIVTWSCRRSDRTNGCCPKRDEFRAPSNGYEKDEMVSHGFRSSASTILNARRFDADVIETALAHQDEDTIRRAYNRATYWPERVKLLQDWADLLTNSGSLSQPRAQHDSPLRQFGQPSSYVHVCLG